MGDMGTSHSGRSQHPKNNLRATFKFPRSFRDGTVVISRDMAMPDGI